MSGKRDGKVAVITGGNSGSGLAYYWNRTVKQEEKTQLVGDDIPTIESVFDLKSGARARLVDRSGSMVIIEIDKYRSDWIEWSEVKARIAAKDR